MADPRITYESRDAKPVVLYTKRDENDGSAFPTSFGIGLPPYDFVDLVISSATETYQFRTTGSTGTLVATLVIVYTDTTRADIFTVTKTIA